MRAFVKVLQKRWRARPDVHEEFIQEWVNLVLDSLKGGSVFNPTIMTPTLTSSERVPNIALLRLHHALRAFGNRLVGKNSIRSKPPSCDPAAISFETKSPAKEKNKHYKNPSD